ncbi:MAG: hypothetical protein WBV82_17660 [Myxococcaceae bacterium]
MGGDVAGASSAARRTTQELKIPSGQYQAQILFTRDGKTQTVQMSVHIEGDIVPVCVRPP